MPQQLAPRCAIIVCHPRPDSFCATLAHRAESVAEELGYRTIMRDLYSMGFDPVLHARDIALHKGGSRPAPDVEQELQLLDDPEVIILVYPIWFGSAPGLLKGYIERVLGAGFAGPGSVPAPSAERPEVLMTIATSGASTEWIASKGIAASAGRTFGAYLAGALQIPKAEHIAIDNVIPTMSASKAEIALKKVDAEITASLTQLVGPRHPNWETLPSPTA